ncbi:MAG: hypothetical protein HKN25_04655, partial [Pyrinomonadaceae bacterium]|nr:hypothetical protein [Pyrinomonadaceae bacterium]
MTLFTILIFTIFGITSSSEKWECRNDLEIRCADGNCKTQEKGSSTPMSVSFDDSGMMSVCAYSGCWEGKGNVFRSGDFLSLAGHGLKFSTSPERAEMNRDISITLDRKDNVAMLKAGEFAHPMVCKIAEGSQSEPRFSDYKVKVRTAKPRAIRFRNNRQARMFRTRLKAALKG